LQIGTPVHTTSKDSFAAELVDDGAQFIYHVVAYYSANWRQRRLADPEKDLRVRGRSGVRLERRSVYLLVKSMIL
jgi:hypothetical protein